MKSKNLKIESKVISNGYLHREAKTEVRPEPITSVRESVGAHEAVEAHEPTGTYEPMTQGPMGTQTSARGVISENIDDRICLAEGVVDTLEEALKRPNLNTMLIGMTGSGKSVSYVYPRLLYNRSFSVVVPLTKRSVMNKFDKLYRERGFETQVMDFMNPSRSTVGYDPMKNVRTVRDAIRLAGALIGKEESKSMNGSSDPYWNQSATSVLAAIILLAMAEARFRGREARFTDVISLYRSMEITDNDNFECNLDRRFDRAEVRYPGNGALSLWKTIRGLSYKTSSCIISVLNSAIDKITSDEIMEMTNMEDQISFEDLGRQKTILFVITSAFDKSLQKFVNLMYADMFRVLFESAEKNEKETLDVPVHVICDDFACGCPIQDFEDYISIFRAAGISVSLLLQSESQLESLYGQGSAQTIINNCATYIYMGGMDFCTCNHLSQKVDRSVKHIMSMPRETVLVMRAGMDTVEARRYQIFDDTEYRAIFGEEENVK